MIDRNGKSRLVVLLAAASILSVALAIGVHADSQPTINISSNPIGAALGVLYIYAETPLLDNYWGALAFGYAIDAGLGILGPLGLFANSRYSAWGVRIGANLYPLGSALEGLFIGMAVHLGAADDWGTLRFRLLKDTEITLESGDTTTVAADTILQTGDYPSASQQYGGLLHAGYRWAMHPLSITLRLGLCVLAVFDSGRWYVFPWFNYGSEYSVDIGIVL